MNDEPTTYVLLITDKSGSMYGLADDVRGGYNSYMHSLQADTDASYRVTSVLFSSRSAGDDDGFTVLCAGARPADVPRLDAHSYQPAGTTALLDAIGKTIATFEAQTTLGRADRVLLVVQTDGQENASTEYTRETVGKMIADREAGGQWAAIFMGAGPDTWRQAGGMGFGSSLSYAADAGGVADSYAGMAAATRSYSRGGTRSEAAFASGLTVETDD